jgi:3-phenylpropionate/cinnamic acid dioxygenase small subunit
VRILAASDEEVRVASNFVLTEARLDRERSLGGAYEHVLRRENGCWRIRVKKVALLSNNLPLTAITFLL